MDKKQLSQTAASLLVIGAIVFGVAKLLQFLWATFSAVNPTIGAGIIAAAATIMVSVISVLVAKRLEFKTVVAKEHREKKIPFYEDMIKFIFRMVFAEKLGLEPLTEREMIKQMTNFTENLVIWGADEVIQAWFVFRNHSVRGEDAGGIIMFDIENLLLAIRKDLGHANRGLTKGRILGLFVNDIHEHVRA